MKYTNYIIDNTKAFKTILHLKFYGDDFKIINSEYVVMKRREWIIDLKIWRKLSTNKLGRWRCEYMHRT
jgi:hypothetical protein